MNKNFSFGISSLDMLLADALVPGTLMVIAGHPGSGKTTLASTICASNAERGHKCLYITFQEDREKLLDNMEKLGIKIKQLEQKNMVNFINMPAMLDVEDAVKEISSLLHEHDSKILVVDSLNSLLMHVESSRSRAILQNFFYNVSRMTGGLIILVAELPLGSDRLDLGSAEFIADIVLVLKHNIERGLIARSMEFRKVRGTPITIAEAPFSIISGKGIQVWAPMVPELAEEREAFVMPCRLLEETIHFIRRGEVLFFSYPPDARVAEQALGIAPLLLSFARLNNLKIVFISYRYPGSTIKHVYTDIIASRLGFDRNTVAKVFDEHIVFRGLNPYSFSIGELMARVSEIISEAGGADVLALHATELHYLVENPDRYVSFLSNYLNHLRSKGVSTIILGSNVSDNYYNLNAILADIIVSYRKGCGEEPAKCYTLIWRKGGDTQHVLPSEDTIGCIREAYENIKEMIQK